MIYLLLLAVSPYGEISVDRFANDYARAYEQGQLEQFAASKKKSRVFWTVKVKSVEHRKRSSPVPGDKTPGYQNVITAEKTFTDGAKLTIYEWTWGKPLNVEPGDILEIKADISSIDQYEVSLDIWELKVNP